MNNKSPCPRCDFRSVCRFETAINQYRHLPAFGREEIFVKLTQGGKTMKND